MATLATNRVNTGSSRLTRSAKVRGRAKISWTIMDVLAGCAARRRTRRMVVLCKRSATQQRARRCGQNVQVISARRLSVGTSTSEITKLAVAGYRQDRLQEAVVRTLTVYSRSDNVRHCRKMYFPGQHLPANALESAVGRGVQGAGAPYGHVFSFFN